MSYMILYFTNIQVKDEHYQKANVSYNGTSIDQRIKDSYIRETKDYSFAETLFFCTGGELLEMHA